MPRHLESRSESAIARKARGCKILAISILQGNYSPFFAGANLPAHFPASLQEFSFTGKIDRLNACTDSRYLPIPAGKGLSGQSGTDRKESQCQANARFRRNALNQGTGRNKDDMKLYWAKVRENAVIPTKRYEDAGYDLYPCFDQDWLEILPLHTELVPLGVASAFDPEYVLFLKERGSTGIKGMSVRAGVMDSGYRGEYLAPITNVNDKPLRIIKKEALDKMSESEKDSFIAYPYEKACAQGVLLVMPQIESEEISYEDLRQIASLREAGRLGSSGK